MTAPTTTYAFVTVDVFTTERFAGNPLAVILDASGMSDECMQAIAAEFGYSESTFVLPPRDPAHTAEVRIFTPVTEVPFAGHPNVGTAFVLANMPEVFGKAPGDRLVFEEKAGLVEVEVQRKDGRAVSASIVAPKPLSIGSTVDTALLARCASLTGADIETARHAPVFVSVGLKFIVAEVASLEALGRAKPELGALAEAVERYAHENCDCALFLYTRQGGNHLRARMFAPFDNVPEDPATGSASAALGAYLATLAGEPDLEMDFRIEQGVEMKRRSEIGIRVSKKDGVATRVAISGASVEILRGTLHA
ncbi:PhzF family phenazine biosynthesis protein [Rhizobium sp. CG5]|uniref:PhzF family phenazine biosynthesis protein n=1 Tax=Rhizobium sp. CG5 TaxID=2726076 RepID=UPI00203468C1|nr:PhzF family phenazine biosynthesis protein [Rhizobium sp. CG5]MCM2473389.1 PhzF family phenazine biosynthesis protein [Rhizobium sp. CG5]